MKNKNQKSKQEKIIYTKFLTLPSKLKDAKKIYPNAKLYDCADCDPGYKGNQPIQYLVDTVEGIAFEFFYDTSSKTMLLWRIYVFNRTSSFIPNGCLGGGLNFVLH